MEATRPIVLVGECTGVWVPRLQRLGWGRMWIARDRRIYTYPGEPWGLDNGAYRDYLAGRPLDTKAFRRAHVERVLGLDGHPASPGPSITVKRTPPLLIACPDIVGGGLESLKYSLKWAAGTPREVWEHFGVDPDDDRFGSYFTPANRKVPLYLVVQDGMTPDDVAPWLGPIYPDYAGDVGTWRRFAGIFLGGTDAFKPTAGVWSELAHAHGLRFHYGRCSTFDRLEQAFEVGADSVDSTMIQRKPPSWQREFTRRWIQLGRRSVDFDLADFDRPRKVA